MKKFREIIYYGLALSMFGMLFPQTAKAETQRLDLTASPPLFNLTSTPGATVNERIRLRNNSTNSINLKIDVRKMESNGEYGDAKISPYDDNLEATKWVTFEKTSFTALPNEYTFVPYTIKIPETAAFGYYFVFYITSETSDTPTVEGGSEVSGAVAIPVLLNVQKAGAKAEAKILSFNAKRYINEYLPVDFSVRVSNSGNIHISPRGNIFVKSGGNDIATLNVNAGLGNILPDSTREFSSSWEDGFLVQKPNQANGTIVMDKNGNPTYHLDYNWNKLSKFRIGKYTATLILVYNDGVRDIPLEATTSFWVIPYKLIALLIIILSFIFFIIRLTIKSYIKKQVNKLKRRL